MPPRANELPVWLNDGDRLLTRAREHRERFESAGDAMHLNLATVDYYRASSTYLRGVLQDEGTPVARLTGNPRKDAIDAAEAVRGEYRSHAVAAVRAADSTAVAPDSRHASMRYARTLAEHIRAGFPAALEADKGRGGPKQDRTPTPGRGR
jgi:hypothetical protein